MPNAKPQGVKAKAKAKHQSTKAPKQQSTSRKMLRWFQRSKSKTPTVLSTMGVGLNK
jgi:aminoglycoside phosphotransferase